MNIDSIKNDDEKENILQARGIVKEFSGVRVLDNVDFDLRKGEVHAIMGENGAGKSTLVKILTGVFSYNSGKILIDNKEMHFKDPKASESAGIRIIYQEFSQVPQLSIAENLFLGKKPKKKYLGFIRFIDWKYINNYAQKWLDEFNVSENPTTLVKYIGVAKMQLIEIIKATSVDSRILIMDEPTASLSSQEIEFLFGIIAELKKKGVSIIYISHRIEEVKLIADRVTILRDGKNIFTKDVANCTNELIINTMVGKKLSDMFPPISKKSNEVLLEINNLSMPHKFRNVSFTVNKGEIVGITGLVGAGKTEIAQTIFGVNNNYSGDIILNGQEKKIKSVIDAKNAGIALVPEDRKFQGIIAKLSGRDNISLPNLKMFKNKVHLLNVKKETATVKKYFDIVDIRPRDYFKPVMYFSGGNQQKISVSKWLCSDAKLYMFDEPTRGIDVGAKTEVYKLIARLAEEGCGVIIYSSEVEEVINMSHKIVILNRGNVTSIRSSNETGLKNLILKEIGSAYNK